MCKFFLKTMVDEFSTIGTFIIITIALVSVRDKQMIQENLKNKITLKFK
jgi:hypothetical protein